MAFNIKYSIFLSIAMLTSAILYSQNDKIVYTGGDFYMSDYSISTLIPKGKNATVTYDTYFLSYNIQYTDEDGTRRYVLFKYAGSIGKYLSDGKYYYLLNEQKFKEEAGNGKGTLCFRGNNMIFWVFDLKSKSAVENIKKEKIQNGTVKIEDNGKGDYKEITYKNGYIIKSVSYDKWRKSLDFSYKNNLKHGISHMYYLNSGKVASETMYENGKKVGSEKFFDQNGNRIYK